MKFAFVFLLVGMFLPDFATEVVAEVEEAKVASSEVVSEAIEKYEEFCKTDQVFDLEAHKAALGELGVTLHKKVAKAILYVAKKYRDKGRDDQSELRQELIRAEAIRVLIAQRDLDKRDLRGAVIQMVKFLDDRKIAGPVGAAAIEFLDKVCYEQAWEFIEEAVLHPNLEVASAALKVFEERRESRILCTGKPFCQLWAKAFGSGGSTSYSPNRRTATSSAHGDAQAKKAYRGAAGVSSEEFELLIVNLTKELTGGLEFGSAGDFHAWVRKNEDEIARR